MYSFSFAFESVDNDSSSYHVFTPEELDISNPMMMGQYPAELPVYINMLPNMTDESCMVDVANILPGPLSPRKAWPKSSNWTDKTFQERNKLVDAEMLAQEKWIRSTKEFDKMRSVVMEEDNAMYPSDHFDYGYTRNVYLHIRNLESMVVDTLYQRMQQSPCFKSIDDKYIRMNEELLPTQTERLEKIRAEIYASRRKNRARYKNLVVTDEEVNSELTRREEEARKQKMLAFRSVKYYSDTNQSYCDMCNLRWPKPGKASSLPEHFKIRKWIGNKEVKDISTNTNRNSNFGG